MSLKTSHSHPLRIAAILTPGGGLLGVTFCPGKKDRHSAWDRDLDADLQAISAWGAQLLLTLIEDHEFALLGVEPLGARAQAAGMAWLHLPIRDVDVPDQRFEAGWREAGARVHSLLHGRGRVVVHCRGGLGRAGTVAARVLVEQGMDPRAAIRSVRHARPGAIETPAQERYVLGLQPRAAGTAPARAGSVPPGAQGAAQLDRRERIRGCVLGGAIGDAFGYCVEFSRWSEIERRYGTHGIQEPALHGGRLVVSDDTQMTLFTLEGLLRACARDADHDAIIDEIRLAYLDWHLTQGGTVNAAALAGTLGTYATLQHPRAPGRTCLDALAAGARGTLQRPINHSKGCGGVMRVAPLAFFPERLPLAAAVELGARAAALTHGHPSGYLSAAALVGILHLLMQGVALAPATHAVLPLLQAYPGSAETVDAINRALDFSSSRGAPREAVRTLGEGWVGEEALAVGLYAALVGADCKDALRIASNHDGDSDSTASIAGQLYGAWRGERSLPAEWVERLDVLAPIEELLAQATAVPAR